MPALNVIHVSDSEQTAQLLGRHLHWAWSISFARRRLDKCRRESGMEGHISFDLLHGLVNVPVQHRDGSKSLQIRESLRAVVGAPSPLRINCPERDMSKDNNRSAGFEVSDIIFKPLKLVVPQRPQATSFEIHDVDQADEVDSVLVKAVPTATFRVLPVAFAKHFSIIV